MRIAQVAPLHERVLGRDAVPRSARGPLSIRAEAGLLTFCFSAGSRPRNAPMRRSAPRVGPGIPLQGR